MAAGKRNPNTEIRSIYHCDSEGGEKQTVVADLDGTLLVGRNSFPYFVLLAFDVGGYLRFLLLLLVSPLAAIMYHLVSESAGIKVLIFVTFAGVRVSVIKSAASAVLPKYFSDDVHPETWRVFSLCGRKCVLTANPRVMVEPFLKNYLGVDVVLGTEIASYKGFATGFVAGEGVLVGKKKAVALSKEFGSAEMPDIGVGDRKSDLAFMKLCKEMYMVPRRPKPRPMSPESLPKPVIFHDGRLVQKPTPLTALLIAVYFPLGVVLSAVRFFILAVFPLSISHYLLSLCGCKATVGGSVPPKNAKLSSSGKGVVFVCSHRTVCDAVVVSALLGRKATAITFSISAFTKFMSPIKLYSLTRERTKDATLIENILDAGEYLVMFPEGTTCREPYLLRFSSLFAELTDQIVPVAIDVKVSMFYGTTARGHKWMDPFFYLMNPSPRYEVTFLDKLPPEMTCKAGKSSHEVANTVQEMIAKTLNFKCTMLTRKIKYRELVGTDGLVEQKPVCSSKVTG